MRLTPEENKFLERRSRAVRTWPLVGGGLLCLLVGLGAWLFRFSPGLANPFFVLERIRSNTLTEADLSLTAAMLPIVTWACLALAGVMVLLGFAGIRNERRHLAVIRRLLALGGDPARPGRSQTRMDGSTINKGRAE